MKVPPDATLHPYTWNHRKRNAIPGVMVRSETASVFIPHDQLATFADAMIDALETYETETE